MSRIMTAACWLLIPLLFCSCAEEDKPASNAAANPKVNLAAAQPNADDILAQVAEFYQSVNTVQVICDRQVDVEMNGRPSSSTSQLKFIAERPNRLFVEAGNQSSVIRGVSDGETLFAYMSTLGKYSSGPAPADFDRLAANRFLMVTGGGVASLPLQLLTAAPIAPLLQNVTSSTYVETAQLDGNYVHHLKFQQQSSMQGTTSETELWVAAEGDPVIRRFRRTVQGEQRTRFRNVLTETYRNWKFNEPPAADAFAFTPPDGAEEVDDIIVAAFGSPGGRQPVPASPPVPSSGNPLIDLFRSIDRGVKSTTPGKAESKPNPDPVQAPDPGNAEEPDQPPQE